MSTAFNVNRKSSVDIFMRFVRYRYTELKQKGPRDWFRFTCCEINKSEEHLYEIAKSIRLCCIIESLIKNSEIKNYDQCGTLILFEIRREHTVINTI